MTADISDAFLMVPQVVPTVVRLPGTSTWARLYRLVPGQRSGAHDWSVHIGSILTKRGVQPSVTCPSLYTGDCLAIAVHVDDLLLVGKRELMQDMINHLEKHDLKVKAAGPFTVETVFIF